MNKLYVGNLSYKVTDDDLQSLFSSHGELTDVRLIRDRSTGRSKGFAFVEYKDQVSAKEALDALNGQDFQGRPLRVSIARDRDEGSPREREFRED